LSSNIEIAQKAKMQRITEVAKRLGIPEDELETYGNTLKA
jgi:formyltetrahydrofolate synthetase